ncbi:LAMI_0E13476g1_1 [Lachancea mirantina]|uniref:Protein BCP1 n=1 Tax=Lachancea mirantina TaxID=1230905 RepID=A0A1G4JQW3_9SACH|nr:LAMI_0E13476g1_1 [Lachancea mirantina]
MVQSVKVSEIVKRRRETEDSDSDIDISSTDSETEVGLDQNEEVVNVDFDFYDGNKNVDFHALKHLMRQLFGSHESNRIQLSALADMILDSPTTTIKTDGPESDPYSFLSLVDYKANRNSDYAQYLHKIDDRLSKQLNKIEASNQSCAMLLGERLINMPPEIIAPLYRITLEDALKNSGNGKHYDWYVIVSRKFEVNLDVDQDEQQKQSAKKRARTAEIDYFHPEDAFFERHAALHFDGDGRKGLIPTYVVISHDSLNKAIAECELEIAKW